MFDNLPLTANFRAHSLCRRITTWSRPGRLSSGRKSRPSIAVLYAAGLRVPEACALRWRNLQARGDAGRSLIHGKGGRTRVVLPPAGLSGQFAPLKGTAAPDSPVFASRSGKPLERSRVRRIVRAASEPGIDAEVSSHWLRHAHASHALDRGAPIHLVQATLGHRSVATTSLYLHARPGESSAGYLAAWLSLSDIFTLKKLPLPGGTEFCMEKPRSLNPWNHGCAGRRRSAPLPISKAPLLWRILQTASGRRRT